MSFRTKLDYSDNRQIKQRERTSTVLSGTTVFGVPFSGLTTGIDYSTTGITESNLNLVYGSFSGNTTATTFTWPDTRMSIIDTYLSVITKNLTSLANGVTDTEHAHYINIPEKSIVTLSLFTKFCLKKYFRSLGQHVSGNKPELIERAKG